MVASNLGESKARVGEMGRNSKGSRGEGKKIPKDTKLYNLTSGREVVKSTHVVEDTEVTGRGGCGDFKNKNNLLKPEGVVDIFEKVSDFWGPKLGGGTITQDSEAFSRKEISKKTHKIVAGSFIYASERSERTIMSTATIITTTTTTAATTTTVTIPALRGVRVGSGSNRGS